MITMMLVPACDSCDFEHSPKKYESRHGKPEAFRNVRRRSREIYASVAPFGLRSFHV
jgi:hypothetical protein